MDREQSVRQELAELRSRVTLLEEELIHLEAKKEWPPREFYGVYYGLAGSVLGLIGATASLLFNVIGSTLVGNPPLKLIQVYLTFPLGEEAKSMQSGLALSIGCCLYLLTGMVLGIPFSLILNRWFANSGFVVRFVVVTLLSLALWSVNFYGILSWLQPRLFGGRWIVEEIPPLVGAGTHLVFGWTLLLLQPFSRFVAFSNRVEER